MSELLTMIEAYGQRMTAGDEAGALEQLIAITKRLDDPAESEFAEFWKQVPEKLVGAEPTDPEFTKKLAQLAWLDGRATLAKGAAHPRRSL